MTLARTEHEQSGEEECEAGAAPHASAGARRGCHGGHSLSLPDRPQGTTAMQWEGKLRYRSIAVALATWLLLACGASAAELSTSERLKDRRYVTARRARVRDRLRGRSLLRAGLAHQRRDGRRLVAAAKFVDGVWSAWATSGWARPPNSHPDGAMCAWASPQRRLDALAHGLPCGQGTPRSAVRAHDREPRRRPHGGREGGRALERSATTRGPGRRRTQWFPTCRTAAATTTAPFCSASRTPRPTPTPRRMTGPPLVGSTPTPVGRRGRVPALPPGRRHGAAGRGAVYGERPAALATTAPRARGRVAGCATRSSVGPVARTLWIGVRSRRRPSGREGGAGQGPWPTPRAALRAKITRRERGARWSSFAPGRPAGRGHRLGQAEPARPRPGGARPRDPRGPRRQGIPAAVRGRASTCASSALAGPTTRGCSPPTASTRPSPASRSASSSRSWTTSAGCAT